MSIKKIEPSNPMYTVSCKSCIHNNVCYTKKTVDGMEEQVRCFGCRDYFLNSTMTAEWIYDENGNDWGLGAWICSQCGSKNDNLGMNKDIDPYVFAGSKFCPHCGLRMSRQLNSGVL